MKTHDGATYRTGVMERLNGIESRSRILPGLQAILMRVGFAVLVLVTATSQNCACGCDLMVDWTTQYVRDGEDQVKDFLKLDLNSYVICGEHTLDGLGRSGFISHLNGDSILWSIFLRDSGVTAIYALDQLDENTIVFAGTSYRPAFGYNAIVGASSFDGQLLWLRFYDELDAWFAFDLRATHDSSIVVAGGTPYAFDQQDAVVFKVDAAGTLQWSKAFGGATSEHFEAIDILSTGEIVAAGTGDDPTDFVQRLFVAKVTESGDSVWARYIGSEPYVTGRSVTVVGDTLIAVAATYFRPDVRGQVQIVALDTNGFERWLVEFGSEYDDGAFDIQFDQYNNHLVYCGAKLSSIDAQLNTAIGMTDLYGNAVDSLVIEDSLATFGAAMTIDDSCVLLIGGYGWDSRLGRDREPFIVRLVSDISGNISIPPVNEAVIQTNFFPNPVLESGTLVIKGAFNDPITVSIYNILGQEIVQYAIPRSINDPIVHSFDSGHLPAGIYIYDVRAAERTSRGKFVVIR